MTMREKAKKLAELQTDIWFDYDAGHFEKVTEDARQMFLLQGFEEKEALKAGEYVSEAHLHYENAVNANEDNRIGDREYCFVKALESEILVRNILDQPVRPAYAENLWWRHFHYHNYGRATYYIFKNLFLKYKGWNFIPPVRAAYYLIIAGKKGHNERNKEAAVKYLTKYWIIVLANKGFIEIIQY
ncbi:MAG: hypothetical protein GY754_29850 [bacterium]|nr:hypothetical protein [bacterium]